MEFKTLSGIAIDSSESIFNNQISKVRKMSFHYHANYAKLIEIHNDLKSMTNLDCVEFMDYIRKQVTGDTNHFYHGFRQQEGQRILIPYFSPITHVRWQYVGLWCFVLCFMGGNENLHAWCVEKRENKQEKIFMTHKVEDSIVPFAHFENTLKFIQYDEWFHSILSMVDHIKAKGIDKTAVEMYFSIFGVIIRENNRKDVALLWKCYEWVP